MRFSFVRTGIVATAAAIALAACGGRGIVPSQSAAPDLSLVPQASNPCYTSAVQPAWIFKGACKITTLPTKGATVKLGAYKTITSVTVTFPKNNGKNKGFVVVDAVGGTDIMKYKNAAFPPLPSSIGKSAGYIEAVNGFAGLKFTAGNLVLSLTATKLPGKTCAVSLLEPKSKGYLWTKLPVPTLVKGNTDTLTVPGTQVGILFSKGLPAGPLYFNVSCT